ncbi:MAG: proton extrusion protein PcxA [Prochlorococcaceae cyanobacterium]
MGLNLWFGGSGADQSSRRPSGVRLSESLEKAYEAALMIQGLELEFFQDRPVRTDIDLGLPRATQAQIHRRFRSGLAICRELVANLERHRAEFDPQELRQLQLIETVVRRYNSGSANSLSRRPDPLPRSLLGVFDNVRNQLDPEAEASVVAGFRRRRDSTLVSLRILLLLVLVPLLLQQVTRAYLISPLVDRYGSDVAFLSYTKPRLEEKAVEKLRIYREELEFAALIEGREQPSNEELRQQLTERAAELKSEADDESTSAIKNVLADGIALLGFVLVCLLGREELRVLRGFLDETVYGLSDSAKAFVIILFTDIFVGFHSPEGWTVLIEGISEHLGLPPEQKFVDLFIATFPVILATIFKYWIFRYLNRVSPSSVATLRNMNGGG